MPHEGSRPSRPALQATMETVRPCGCKGIRTCLICEKEHNIVKSDFSSELKKRTSYIYCPQCDKAYPGWNINSDNRHPDHHGSPIDFPGTFIKLDFLNSNELQTTIEGLDDLPWEPSQSGRRKQNFGPKVNFKKRRLKLGDFSGFPKCTRFIQEKFRDLDILRDFLTIEQCSLEYDPKKGASIDPHIDDCWIWGERIITVNVLGHSVLTMTPYIGPPNRYNLDLSDQKSAETKIDSNIVVRLPMPEGSLMVLYDDSRYKWEHSILREDITSRRVCIAYREFTKPYLPDKDGNCNEEVLVILKNANQYW